MSHLYELFVNIVKSTYSLADGVLSSVSNSIVFEVEEEPPTLNSMYVVLLLVSWA